MNKIKIGMLVAFIMLPTVTFAYVRTLKDVIDLVIRYLGYLIPLIMSLAIVVFIWGVYKYFFKVDANKEEAGNLVLYGVLGFFLMISFWGLVNILINTFGLETRIPGIPFIRSSGSSGNTLFMNPSSNSGDTMFMNPSSNSGDTMFMNPR